MLKILLVCFVLIIAVFLYTFNGNFTSASAPNVYLFDKLYYGDGLSCGQKSKPRCAAQVNERTRTCFKESRIYWTSKDGIFLKSVRPIYDLKAKLALCGITFEGSVKDVSLNFQKEWRNISLLIILMMLPLLLIFSPSIRYKKNRK